MAARENHRVEVFGLDGMFEAQRGNLAMASCFHIERSGDELVPLWEFYAGIPENPGGIGNWTGRRLGPRVSILDKSGNVVARVGDLPIGEGHGQFIAPHGIAVDTRGDIYVAEVSFSAYGARLDSP